MHKPSSDSRVKSVPSSHSPVRLHCPEASSAPSADGFRSRLLGRWRSRRLRHFRLAGLGSPERRLQGLSVLGFFSAVNRTKNPLGLGCIMYAPPSVRSIKVWLCAAYAPLWASPLYWQEKRTRKAQSSLPKSQLSLYPPLDALVHVLKVSDKLIQLLEDGSPTQAGAWLYSLLSRIQVLRCN